MYQCHACPDYTVRPLRRPDGGIACSIACSETLTRLAQQGGLDSPRPLGPLCPLLARMGAGAAVRDAEHALERAQADVRYGIRVAEAQEIIRRTLEALPALREAREYVLTHTYLPPLPSRGYTPAVVF